MKSSYCFFFFLSEAKKANKFKYKHKQDKNDSQPWDI